MTTTYKPIFRLVTPPGITCASSGTRLYAFDQEVQPIESVSVETIVPGAEDIVRTKITITLLGSMVETEVLDKEGPVPRLRKPTDGWPYIEGDTGLGYSGK